MPVDLLEGMMEADQPVDLLAGIGVQSAMPAATSIGRTLLDQSLQGATFNFADEISAPIGAGFAKLFGGEATRGTSFWELYDEARKRQAFNLEQQAEQNPATSLAANIGGALFTGGAGATTKAGQAAGRSLMSGPLAAQMAKGAVAGAATGGVAGFGAGEGGASERLDDAGEGAAWGAALGTLTPAVITGLKSIGKKAITLPAKTAEDLRNLSHVHYQMAAEKGGALKPEFTNKFLGEVEKIKPQTEAGRLLAGDSRTTKIAESFKALKDRPINLAEAQEIDEFLGDTIDSLMDGGRLTKEARKILDVQTSFREMIQKAPASDMVGGKEGFEALKEGRKLWSAYAKMRDIEKIVTRAEMMEQPATGIKTGFRTLYNNPSRMRGYTAAEREAVKKAAESGIVGDALKISSSRLLPIITASTGGGLTGTAAAQAIGAGSRSAAYKLQAGRAQEVADEILKEAFGQPSALPKSKIVDDILQSPKSHLIPAIVAGSSGGLISK